MLPVMTSRHFAQDNAAINVFVRRGERVGAEAVERYDALRRHMILEQITEQLTETLQAPRPRALRPPVDRVVLQAPPKLNMGDLATPLALELAKALKRKPREIAEALANGLAAADARRSR